MFKSFVFQAFTLPTVYIQASPKCWWYGCGSSKILPFTLTSSSPTTPQSRKFSINTMCQYLNILHTVRLKNFLQIQGRMLVNSSVSSRGKPACPQTPPESPQSQGPWEIQLWEIPDMQQLACLSCDWELPTHKTFKNWKIICLGMAHRSHLCALSLLVRAGVFTLIYCVRPESYTVEAEVSSCSCLNGTSLSNFPCLH